MKVVAVCARKGGVGKTTLCRELAALAALRGLSVLMIDADPQGNLTETWADKDEVGARPNLAHVLIPGVGENKPLGRVIYETVIPNLDMVGCDSQLAGFNYITDDERLHELRYQLDEHGTKYDLVFIDSTIYAGRIQSLVLYAADYVLIPCAPLIVGANNVVELAEAVRRIKKRPNPGLEILGVVMNMFRPDWRLSYEIREAVEAGVEVNDLHRVFRTNIHHYRDIARAPGSRLPVMVYAPKSRAAEQLSALADEVFEAMGFERKRESDDEGAREVYVTAAEVSGRGRDDGAAATEAA